MGCAGWEPEDFYPDTGSVEQYMAFKTRSHHEHEDDYSWTVTEYDPHQALIEYTVFTPVRLWWIMIRCRDGIVGGTTLAEITYTYVGLTDRDNAINQRAIEKMYHRNLKDWEEAINYYLETGQRLRH